MEKYLNNCKFQMILGSSLKMWIFLTKLKNPKLINLMSCTFKSEQDQNKPLGAWKSGSSSTSRRISYPLYLSGTSFRLGRFSDFSFLFGLTGAAFFSSSGSSTYSKYIHLKLACLNSTTYSTNIVRHVLSQRI